jgi:hypothetical protein
MSETPRTDNAAMAWKNHQDRRGCSMWRTPHGGVVFAEFARELERELAQRTAALDQMTVHRNAAIEHRDITQQVLNGITVALSQRTADLSKAKAERDEARRLFCKLHAGVEAVGYAEGRGWDCFDAPHANATDGRVQNGGA